jgi:ComF family protein
MFPEPISSLFQFLYPSLCESCHERYVLKSELFCTHCLYQLPFTNFSYEDENIFTRHFWGRIPIQYGHALFYYVKKGPVPKMIKRIKYKNEPELAIRIGQEYGHHLKTQGIDQSVNYLIPVPSHKKKIRQRGYNQAALLCKGMSRVLGIPILSDVLIRTEYNSSQTTKTRNERVQNLSNSFSVQQNPFTSNDHVLLVDDVLTTGATLEACGAALLAEAPEISLSLACLALGLNQ